MTDVPIFDAHLDMAMNAVHYGRDVTRPAADQPTIGTEIATVGLPDLRRGNVRHFCGTIFCLPHSDKEPGYKTPDEAWALANQQLDVYQSLHQRGEIDLNGESTNDVTPRCTVLLEGADCVRNVDDVPALKARHVRVIGLSWRKSRYAGGTGHPGPLTTEGREVVRAIDQSGLIHDVSHLAEQSFWQLIDLASGPVIASHSNCRAIVGDDPGERHLSDEMIRALVRRGGVVGINVFDKFLLPTGEYGKRRATLADVVAHIRRVCDLAGDTAHVGIGTDMDGGLGRNDIPEEIENSGDLPKLLDALKTAGFGDSDVRSIAFDNWNRIIGS